MPGQQIDQIIAKPADKQTNVQHARATSQPTRLSHLGHKNANAISIANAIAIAK